KVTMRRSALGTGFPSFRNGSIALLASPSVMMVMVVVFHSPLFSISRFSFLSTDGSPCGGLGIPFLYGCKSCKKKTGFERKGMEGRRGSGHLVIPPLLRYPIPDERPHTL